MLLDTANLYSSGSVTVSNVGLEIKKYKYPFLLGAREHDIIKNPDQVDFNKREDNLYRAQQTVREIINANITEHSKFLTLTTEDTVLDEKVFRRRLTTFFQAMKREGFTLRYLYVLERQKKRGIKEGNMGSFHAHIIIFNNEFIPFEIINKHWKGNTDIHILDGLKVKDNEKIGSVAWYVCKYITKDNLNDFNKHCYFTSIGLHKPIKFNLPVYKVDDIYIQDPENENYIALNMLLNDYNITEKQTLYSALPFDNTKIQKTTIKRGVPKNEK